VTSKGEGILVVDDEDAVRRLIETVLRNGGYVCEGASNAAQARKCLATGAFSLVLCDVTMPGESGIDFVRTVRADQPDLAIVMVTGVDDPALARTAVELGAYGYVVKPFKSNALLIDVMNALHRRRLELENRRHRERLEELVDERTTELREVVERLKESEGAVQRSRAEMIRRLAWAIEFRDGETGEHIERMSVICAALARQLGLPDDRCELIRIASPLHDIGKIGIPDRVLLNPEPLTEEEWVVMRRHSELGHRLLAGSGEALLDLAATIALTHHERLDGSGYPHGLKGEEIPIEGRIAAVADVFDALTAGRVYQRAYPLEEAIGILRTGRGRLFDPEVVDAFLETLGEILTSITLPAPDGADSAAGGNGLSQ
jgi:putative two-component system response regulator